MSYYCKQSDLEALIGYETLSQLTDDREELATGELNGDITAASATITLADSSALPPAGRIQVGAEKVLYTANTNNNLSGLTRGANNTTATAHSSGAAVTELCKVDTTVRDWAMAAADGEINSYCAVQYAVPLNPVPVTIKNTSAVIAVHYLSGRRKGPSDEEEKRHNCAIRFLQDVARGLPLGADAPGQINAAGPAATTNKADQIFTMGKASDGSAGSLDSY